MNDPEKKALLQIMDDTRFRIESLLPEIDHHLEIYPGWTVREVLEHLAGWDDAAIATLRAHLEDNPLSTPEIRNLDDYNAMSISTRSDMEDEQILREWRSKRGILRKMIEEFPENKFDAPFIVPWGGKSTVTEMLEMFCEHENGHTRDIQKLLHN
jgi:hypothetical protein